MSELSRREMLGLCMAASMAGLLPKAAAAVDSADWSTGLNRRR